GAAVISVMLIERIVAGAHPVVIGDTEAPHSLTFVPDLAAAMLHAARHAQRLAPDGDAELHAPSAPARSQRELIAATSALLDVPVRRPLVVPRIAVRALSPLSTLARELHGIAGIWYAPCVLRPGILAAQEGMRPTSWEDALAATVRSASTARPSPPEARPASVADMSDSAQQTDGATAVSEASRHLDIIIERPWRAVYEFASDPRNLPRWAAGLAGGEVQREVSQWSMNSPMGRVLI